MISNNGKDENGKYHGGKAGDQTGHEWEIRTWYNRPWDCVLRAPTKEVASKLNELSIKSAKNDNIGYDQWQRLTYWTELAKVGYDPAKITTKCESDCSSGVLANVKAVGYLLDDEKLKNVDQNGYTGNMKPILTKAGFKVLTDPKYLTSEKHLEPGDILLNVKSHTAVYVEEPKPQGDPAPAKKSVNEIADEVIAGKWGNGDDRKRKLEAAGYNYSEVQTAVNAKLKTGASKPTPNPAPAPKKDASYSGKVIAKSGLNIRREAAVKDGNIVGVYSYGTTVKILKESNGWGNTDRGWISLKYVQKI